MAHPLKLYGLAALTAALVTANVEADTRPRVTEPPPAAAPFAPPAGIGSLSEAEASALAATIGARVEQIRGLKFKRPVPVRIVTAQEARAHFAKRLAKAFEGEKARHDQKAYQDLGLLPAGFDLQSGILDTLQDQAAGYYDPETGAFSLLGMMPRTTAAILMAHELTHALDDQHYGIDALLAAAGDDDEATTGIAAVVEGSGTLVMTVYLLQEMQAGRLSREALQDFQAVEAARSGSLRAAPVVLQRALVSSYLLGQIFLLRGDLSRLREGLVPADIDRAYRARPVSSEQVLHPEKYWGQNPELPLTLGEHDASSLLGDGWRRASSGTLGELTIGVLTGALMPALDGPGALSSAAWTTEAAAGWGGDRYHHYVSGSGHLTVLATLWDTERDAIEFADAVGSRADRRAFRHANAVVLVAGSAHDRFEAVGAHALQALARSPSR